MIPEEEISKEETFRQTSPDQITMFRAEIDSIDCFSNRFRIGVNVCSE